MSVVNYYECDKCRKRMTQEQESEGALAVSAGTTCGSLCVDCQGNTTVLEAKKISRKLMDDRVAIAKGMSRRG